MVLPTIDDAADEDQTVTPQPSQRTTTDVSNGLRNRRLSRMKSVGSGSDRTARRSSSFMSDSLSETQRSLKAQADDLIRPRADLDGIKHEVESHWHSLPLALAILPAIAGLFFQNGSAFITDVSLLGLAALFLNWSVRLPWDWYRSAQAQIAEVEDAELEAAVEDERPSSSQSTLDNIKAERPVSKSTTSAEAELHMHELAALAACFILPALGALTLHAIRNQLSRPSEGLVNDYNLTIFLLAAEVRPFSHAIKLIQRRTLYLQRTISAAAAATQTQSTLSDLQRRIDDLEKHTSEVVDITTEQQAVNGVTDASLTRAADQALSDIWKTMQPEIDILNRAMRRYEKRMTMHAVQTEARLQDLEAKIRDVVVLAAATQRNSDKKMGKYWPTLLDWLSALVVVPVHNLLWLLGLPRRVGLAILSEIRLRLGFTGGIATRRPNTAPTRSAGREKKKT